MISEVSGPRVIVAFDYSNIEQARRLSRQLDPSLCRIKVGKSMFTRFGPAFVEELQKAGFQIFLDLKYHDIPQQVAGACQAAAELGVWMMSVHVQGGRAMLEAAVEAVAKHSLSHKPLVVGITVLTSLDRGDLQTFGISEELDTLVLRMARLAKEVGLDGVVSSSQEAQELRKQMGKDFTLVTPGIRLETDESADQKRVMTPIAAVAAGVDYLVIGRSITQAKDPLAVLRNINESCGFG